MKKFLKEISKFILYIFLIFISPIIPFFILSFYVNNTCEPGTYMCGVIEFGLFILGTKIFQVYAIAKLTLFMIKNCKSKSLYKFFNSGIEYILLLFFFIILEISFRYFAQHDYIFYHINRIRDLVHEYFFGISLLTSYICIFIVIIIYRIRKYYENISK
uniref:Uncharacterized protein n=1 Tax=uncultured Candidatus Melainabacteria bacterium TaxID=2682970 RepID=A0A650ELJ2_9BACT|nr:hypothetical protein Melaina855_2210 [uncultured Candidatus Melainabacteria bacterium]